MKGAVMRHHLPALLAGALLFFAGCGGAEDESAAGLKVFTGATVFDGQGGPPIENAAITVRGGRIVAVGPAAAVGAPAGAETIDLAGKFVTPGFILGHGHVGGARGLETGPDVYTRENLLDQLALYARYGVTTVLSLGGDGAEAARLRGEQAAPGLNRTRIYIAGAVVDGDTPEAARAQVDRNAEMPVDFIKIRVDDNLGTTKKMPLEAYRATIDQSHQRGLRLAAHLFYLEDAKALLEEGADFLAHSIRDRAADDEVIALLKEKNVCLCPTLTREVSTFVYEDVPEFFSDPFFLKDADPSVLEQLKDPERQKRMRESKAAQQYKVALETASANLKTLADAGVKIVFGTDTGPPARFQGYFEHMEMQLMAEAGLTPEQIVRSATGDAAECLGFDEVGSLQAGKWADFNVFDENPLDDIANTRSLAGVWIAGTRVPASAE